ncbi:M15 family metallopeptidase [Stenotrophomonas sp. SY1]|uniref:M15 family metallopeptidase n=1 Tax=Stenotrophomonas sp. SY1 TaxID=477235 RepID=UPI001E368215|nr:M15 family metallopeptidase [Stenotrophomonas sp. SY1]MCD9088440.1 M15 family metallopeptidase [Stenotrophomonas sp. SY1]
MLLAVTGSALAVDISAAKTPTQAGIVDVSTLVPGIVLDMRYAGTDNFTGRVVPGYEAPRCYLLQPVAEALARVQQRLHAQGYALQLFDCYRPAHSVKSFVAWAHDLSDQQAKARYYPNVDKGRLLDGYIAETSGHSRAATVDLGLLDCREGACVTVDMGTGFDYFDPLAHTASADITPAQRRNRQQLLEAMQAEGFANYAMEWWHFTFKPEPTPDTAYDFPVR